MATNYTEKIAKVEEAIAKKNALIEKREKQIEKILAKMNPLLVSKGIKTIETATKEETHRIEREIYATLKDGECVYQNEVASEIFDFKYKLEDAIESIENARKTIEEKKQIISNYETKRANDQKRYDLLAEMPVCFTEFRDRIVAEMDSNDMAMKYAYLDAKAKRDAIVEDARVKMKAKEIDYSEYEKIVKRAYDEIKLPEYFAFFDKSDEQIDLDNLMDATKFVLGTCHRVIAITGAITDTQSVHITCGNQGHAVINGFIIGKDGKAELETIECAGYNIVRWHLRTIVHDRTQIH